MLNDALTRMYLSRFYLLRSIKHMNYIFIIILDDKRDFNYVYYAQLSSCQLFYYIILYMKKEHYIILKL